MRFKPVVFVTWYDAVRFCNWLHNNKPTGAQGNSTTETGAYTITGSAPNWTVSARQGGALYFLPTENQWYKAAYHKNNGNTNNYWLLATKSDILPNGTVGSQLTSISSSSYNSGVTGYPVANCANFLYADADVNNKFNDGYAATGSTLLDATLVYLTDAGLYSLSPSAYGTFDQGGNVSEWTEVVSGGNRVSRGGAWNSLFDTAAVTAFALRSNGSTNRTLDAPTTSTYARGFRVCKP
jgi:formylglycine-generating enzyme required for sulfatase activity